MTQPLEIAKQMVEALEAIGKVAFEVAQSDTGSKPAYIKAGWVIETCTKAIAHAPALLKRMEGMVQGNWEEKYKTAFNTMKVLMAAPDYYTIGQFKVLMRIAAEKNGEFSKEDWKEFDDKGNLSDADAELLLSKLKPHPPKAGE